MSEWMLSAVSVFVYVWEGVCAKNLFQVFLKPRWNMRDYAAVIIWPLIRVSCTKLIPGISSGSLSAKLLCHLIVLGAFVIVWYQGSFGRRVYAAVLFLAIHELVFFAGYSILAVGGAVLNRLPFWLDMQILDARQFSYIVTAVMDGFLLLMDAVQMLGMYLAVNFYRKRACPPAAFEQRDEVALCMVPAAAGILISLLLRLLMVTVEADRQILLYERYHSLYVLVPLISVTLLAAVLLSYHSYRQLGHLYKERSEKAILQNQVAQLAEFITHMEQTQEQFRMVRHDIRNHIAVLESLLAAGEEQQVREYFVKMQESVGRPDPWIRTGNPVSDAVINSKFQYAGSRMEGIILDADAFCLPNPLPVHVYDLGIILSNGLDNAVEACLYMRQVQPQAEVFIAVRSFQRGKFLFLEVENSFAQTLQWDQDKGELLTTKSDAQAHGIGLHNIRACARRYYGDIDCKVKGESFLLSVMLRV